MIPGIWEEAAQTARAFSGQRGFLTTSTSQGRHPLQRERIHIVGLPLLVQYQLSLQRALPSPQLLVITQFISRAVWKKGKVNTLLIRARL